MKCTDRDSLIILSKGFICMYTVSYLFIVEWQDFSLLQVNFGQYMCTLIEILYPIRARFWVNVCAVNLVCEKHSLKMCWSFQTNSVYMYIFHVGNKNPKGKMTFSSYLVSSGFLWDYRNRSQKNYHYYYHLQFFILKCYSNMK